MDDDQIYGGWIVREYFCGDGEICRTRSKERIFVRAHCADVAELKIHEAYSMDQERWTLNRTSKTYPGDKVSVEGLKTAEELSDESLANLEAKVINV